MKKMILMVALATSMVFTVGNPAIAAKSGTDEAQRTTSFIEYLHYYATPAKITKVGCQYWNHCTGEFTIYGQITAWAEEEIKIISCNGGGGGPL